MSRGEGMAVVWMKGARGENVDEEVWMRMGKVVVGKRWGEGVDGTVWMRRIKNVDSEV